MMFSELSLSVPKTNVTQTISLGAGAEAKTAALPADATVVSVVNNDVFVLAGASPTASTASLHLPVGIYRLDGWAAGEKLSFYSVSGSTVYVTSGV